jgi:hypothetical protein
MAMISEAEKKRRQRAVESSEGSLAMEGQYLDPATRELNRRYIEGELTLQEFSRAIEVHVADMVRSLREDSAAIAV